MFYVSVVLTLIFYICHNSPSFTLKWVNFTIKFNLIKTDFEVHCRKMDKHTFRVIQKIITFSWARKVVSLIFFPSFLEISHFCYALLTRNLDLGFSIYHKIKIICPMLGLCLKTKLQCPYLQEYSQCLQSSHHWRPRLMPLSDHSRCELERVTVQCRQVLTAGLSTEVAFEVCGCHGYCHDQVWVHHCLKTVK